MVDRSLESHRTVKFRKDEFLFKQNDFSKDLYIIKTGAVRIYKNEGDTEIELDTVGPGMVVGEVASIDGGPRSASGVALEESEVIVIPADEFSGILKRIPDWFRKIALILVQRLREVDNKINRSLDGDRTVHAGAIIALMAFSDRCTACDNGFEISLKFVENELITLLNIQVSEVNDILDKLVRRKVLRIDHNRIILPSRESLDVLAESVLHSGKAETPVT